MSCVCVCVSLSISRLSATGLLCDQVEDKHTTHGGGALSLRAVLNTFHSSVRLSQSKPSILDWMCLFVWVGCTLGAKCEFVWFMLMCEYLCVCLLSLLFQRKVSYQELCKCMILVEESRR